MSDTFKIKCKCGRVLNANKQLVGKQVKCPHCSLTFTIPAPNRESSPSVAPTMSGSSDPFSDDWQHPLADSTNALPNSHFGTANPMLTSSFQNPAVASRKKASPKKSNTKTVIILASVAGAILAVGCLVVIIVIVSTSRTSKEKRIARDERAVPNNPTSDGKKTLKSNESVNVVASSKVITKNDAQLFGQKMQQAFKHARETGKFDRVAKLFDFKALAQIVTADMIVNKQDKKEIEERIALYETLGDSLIGDLRTGPNIHYESLGPRQRHGQWITLFRTIGTTPNNYVEFFLSKDSSGNVKAADFSGFSQGTLSLKVHTRVVAAKDVFQKFNIKYKKNTVASFLSSLHDSAVQFDEVRRAGDKARMNEIFYSFPDELKSTRYFFVRHFDAMSSDPSKFKTIDEELTRYFPNDAFGAWLRLALRIRQNPQHDVATAISWIDDLDRALGGDSLLAIDRCLVYMRFGQPRKAWEALQDAEKKGLPKLFEVDFWKIACLVTLEKFDQAVEVANSLDREGVKKLKEKVQAPVFQQFRQSQPYVEWLRKHQ